MKRQKQKPAAISSGSSSLPVDPPKKKRGRATEPKPLAPAEVDARLAGPPLTETLGEETGAVAEEIVATTHALPAEPPRRGKRKNEKPVAPVRETPAGMKQKSTPPIIEKEMSEPVTATETETTAPAGKQTKNKLLSSPPPEKRPVRKSVNKLTSDPAPKRMARVSGKLGATKKQDLEPVVEALDPAAAKVVKKPVVPMTGSDLQSGRETRPAAVPVQAATAPVMASAAVSTEEETTPFLTEHDLYLFNEGTHRRLYERLGAHPIVHDGVAGTYFAVWAPSALQVSVIGEFNGWRTGANPLRLRGVSGVWDGFFPGISRGTVYKYNIVSKNGGKAFDKADPFGFAHEEPPQTASVVTTLEHTWNDGEWMKNRSQANGHKAPMSTYEVHLGSWRRPTDGREFLSYREIAQPLADYVKQVGFTHVELMPVMEHPFFGSWGYQTTGYFAPSSRFGSPGDFMYLVDILHQNGIGVILDWVPSHFPSDGHGLAYFDGTHLFEHEDPRKGFQPDWNSLIFNYSRHEVRSFLISSAIYWLDVYHADGLRVDAVASMLYLDYSRKQGEWVPNKFGGRENLEAVDFLRQLNEAAYSEVPGVQMIAEESTAWPLVSRPPYVGGLGFGMKWDMGWMHDTLEYIAQDPIHRRFHHGKLTFRPIYAYTENFVLPISHDEVVHGKGSLIRKMPGDEWRRFANLRLLLTYMWAVPGKKLLFMGCEFGQWKEWNHDASLDWDSLQSPLHRGVQHLVGDLNRIYRETPAFFATDFDPSGFQWVDANDSDQSVISFLRVGEGGETILCAFNFTPLPRYNYQLGVPRGGDWIEVLNSDAPMYGGSGQGNLGSVEAAPLPLHGRRNSVTITLPPLGAVFLKSVPPESPDSGIAGAVVRSEQTDAHGDKR